MQQQRLTEDYQYYPYGSQGLLRPQIIASLMVSPPEKVVDAAIHLWEQLATQIIIIVGEDGFHSLYARSLYLSVAKFPWLSTSSMAPNAAHRFDALKTTLEGQTPARANEAASLLLITFTDLLASFIGEQLTAHILQLAWSTNTLNTTNKEIQK